MSGEVFRPRADKNVSNFCTDRTQAALFVWNSKKQSFEEIQIKQPQRMEDLEGRPLLIGESFGSRFHAQARHPLLPSFSFVKY
jgi:hypothetical protein